ncbi:MAG: class I SAM-dependent methyltransferase [Acidimicrobiales bacterium]
MDPLLYDAHEHYERDHWWFVGRRSIIEHVIDARLDQPTGLQILDVGCGTGGMLPMLSRFGSVSGLEFETSAVARCRRNYPDFEVTQGEVPFDVPADGSFDLVTSFDVIEHLDDDAKAVRSFAEAVRPGGRVVVTVPAYLWLWSDHDDLNGHRRRYTAGKLAAVLEAEDLVVEHVSYFNSWLLPVVAAARVGSRLARVSKAKPSEFAVPSSAVNQALTRLFASERHLVASSGLPAGVSLLAIARRVDR